MKLRNVVKKNSYYDSATLMLLSSKVGEQIGSTKNVAVMMASDMNKDIMRASGLLNEDGEAASPNDLIFAIRAESDEAIDNAMALAEETLNKRNAKMEQRESDVVRTAEEALSHCDGAKIAVVSLPGKFATREVRKLLKENCHVLLFSDNVSVEDEISLKELAVSKGLLMMGPDCGTAVINGTGLGFANRLRKGNIGLVAASGTGLQEVMTLIHNFGGGVSQALGTGGRDLKASVGGLMMGQCIKMLAEDPQTEIIVVISKPPAAAVMEKMLLQLKHVGKPVVVCFLGGTEQIEAENITMADGLEDAACKALMLAGYPAPDTLCRERDAMSALVSGQKAKLNGQQKYIRGLYCGGTLAYEAMLKMGAALGKVTSNIALDKELQLDAEATSIGHAVLDLGDDAFTVGKPHPMIEPALRGERLLQEAMDPETAVILLDVEIGYGSHENPAAVVLDEIRTAKEMLASGGRQVVFIASICGSYDDFQDYRQQKAMLEAEGVLVMESNALAVDAAILTVS